jgi:rhamnose utilization protein RhaD (predicted bifunctional aldolase and dehydrogenase)
MASANSEKRAELLDLSHKLGDPAKGWAILGEGNASARVDDETFFVKASGSRLATLKESQVAHVRFAPIIALIDSGETPSDVECMDQLRAAAIGPEGVLPSVETLMHAFLLSLPEIEFVGHTHVISINGVVCSRQGWDFLSSGHRLFPDEIVVCGPAACCIEYIKPGLLLAREIRKRVAVHQDKFGAPPKTIFLQNHGFIALGRSAQEVESIHQMADKAALILNAALAAGEPTSLTREQIDEIYVWPAEHFRQRALGLTK